MKRLTYCYPIMKNVSFKLIAEKHIEHLKGRYIIYRVDVDNLRILRLLPTNYVILHPLFYPFWYCWERDYELMYQINKIKSTICEKIVAFDTADSDRLSSKAVDIANYLPDVVVVPSEYARNTYVDSGVCKDKVRVIPHGVSDIFFDNSIVIRSVMRKIASDSRKKILYFITHSFYRKGADLVEKAINELRKRRKDFVLICKTSNLMLENNWSRKNCDYVISGLLSDEEIKTLYDISDLLILPSRGGGFELNGLEALMRNRPVIYPKESCIEEYAGKVVPELGVKIASRPTVLQGNKIHVGRGHEVDLNDFIDKINYALDNIDELKEKVRTRFTREMRERYRWGNIANEIIKVLES